MLDNIPPGYEDPGLKLPKTKRRKRIVKSEIKWPAMKRVWCEIRDEWIMKPVNDDSKNS
jgi:hypothetical protein